MVIGWLGGWVVGSLGGWVGEQAGGRAGRGCDGGGGPGWERPAHRSFGREQACRSHHRAPPLRNGGLVWVGYLSAWRCDAEAATWRCRSCGVKSTTLARHMGSWPLLAFSALSQQERQQFMSSLDNLDATAMTSRATELLERFETQQQAIIWIHPIWPCALPLGATLTPHTGGCRPPW